MRSWQSRRLAGLPPHRPGETFEEQCSAGAEVARRSQPAGRGGPASQGQASGGQARPARRGEGQANDPTPAETSGKLQQARFAAGPSQQEERLKSSTECESRRHFMDRVMAQFRGPPTDVPIADPAWLYNPRDDTSWLSRSARREARG